MPRAPCPATPRQPLTSLCSPVAWACQRFQQLSRRIRLLPPPIRRVSGNLVSGLPPIPLHLVQAIKQGKYVDLPDLLPKALRGAQFNKAHETKEETKLKRRFIITTTLNWMSAFSAYTVVAVHLKPQRAFELAAYTSIIISLARDGRGQAWSRYDQQFRQAAAVNPRAPVAQEGARYLADGVHGCSSTPSHMAPITTGGTGSTTIHINLPQLEQGDLYISPMQVQARMLCTFRRWPRDCPTIATASMPGNVRQAPK